jgi:GAF domain-containing protein
MLLSQQDAALAVAHLARAVHKMFPSSAGVGVSLFGEDGTRLSTASTDTLVEAADGLQYQLGQGPCLSAWATGQVQRIQDTATEDRWPAWSAAAAGAGIRAVLSVPLVHRDHSPGAMKVYATTPSAFGKAEEQLLGLIAEAAATLFGAAQTTDAPVRLSTSLKDALAIRETTGLATGVLMARDHLGPDAARSVLLHRAQTQGLTVAEVATEILATTQERGQDRESTAPGGDAGGGER